MTTLTITEPQIDRLAQKLDAMDLSTEEQAILIAVLDASEQNGVFGAEAEAGSKGDLQLPSPGEGLRSAFIAGKSGEVSGFGVSGSCTVKVK